jgi:hypothetical protein
MAGTVEARVNNTNPTKDALTPAARKAFPMLSDSSWNCYFVGGAV